MKKAEYIEKYGPEAYEAYKEKQRAYAKAHPQKGDRHRPGYFRRYRERRKQVAFTEPPLINM